MMSKLPVGTVTFLFTDIQGSTPLWERNPRAMQDALARHNKFLNEAITAYGGTVFKIIGDSFQASFSNPIRAVEAALEAQRKLLAGPWGDIGPLKVRMGIHVGQTELIDNDYSGHTLNRVARIMGAGHGEQILVSLAVAELVRGHLSGDLALKDMGEHFLKGLAHPEHIFQVIAPDLPVEFPPLVTKDLPRGYELREKIGSGGFGTVYKAYQPGIDREVAIKIVDPEFANKPDFIRRFETEAQVVARLEHPRIVPLYDFWREPDAAYLVMRYLRGGCLLSLLQHGPLQPRVAVELVDQIADGLAAAHRQGIIHGDIKPENILLDEAENFYLSDFGIAMNFGLDGKDPATDAYLLGSPKYVAPEQLMDQVVGLQVDQYSLGICLYEVLAGDHPFPHDSLAQIIENHLHTSLPSIHDQRPEIPKEVDRVLQKATAKDPEARFPDVLAFAAAFRQAVSGGRRLPPAQVYSRPLVAAVPPNPYKGLRAFEEVDSANFFGRQALTQRLVTKLQESAPGERFLAVVGPSGSGKSSLVKAGLIPALRSGSVMGSQEWFFVEMFPGRRPFEELELSLLRIASDPGINLMDILQRDERGLLQAARLALPAKDAQLFLLVDQFEEIFTLSEDRSEVRRFLDNLYMAITEPRSPIRVVITLRADFYDRPLMYPNFSGLVQERTEVVVPLTAEEIKETIYRPAERVGISMEPGLAEAIVNDVIDQPGALPLLEYALTELFERRENGRLTFDAYRSIGGVLGALQRRADESYAGLDERGKEFSRQMFLRLVTLGEGVEDTRRRVLRSELESLNLDGKPVASEGATSLQESGSRIEATPVRSGNGGSPVGFGNDNPEKDRLIANSGNHAVIAEVIQTFGKARLLSFDRDPVTRSPTVELAHEALLREWGQLRTWIDQTRSDLHMELALRRSAGEWIEANRDPSFLLRGAHLDQIENWATETDMLLTAEEHSFLEASLADREARRSVEATRQARVAALERRSLLVTRVLLVVLLLATIVSLSLAGLARGAQVEAESHAIALQTQEVIARDRASALGTQQALSFAQANQLATQVVIAQDEAQARGHAEAQLAGEQEEVKQQARLATSRELAMAAMNNLSIDPERSLLLSIHALSTENTLEAQGALHSAVQASRMRLFLPGTTAEISPDGSRLATSGADGIVRIWDADGSQELLSLSGHTEKVQGLDFRFDGKRLASASHDGTVRVWDVTTGLELLNLDAHEGGSHAVSFSPDGTRLATAGMDDTIKVWDSVSGTLLLTLNAPSGGFHKGNSLAFSPNGRYLAVAGSDGNVLLWDMRTGRTALRMKGRPPVAFQPQGTSLASMDEGGSQVVIWDLPGSLAAEAGIIRATLGGFTNPILEIAYSPDGAHLATGSLDGSALLWSLDSEGGHKLLDLPGHIGAIWDISFSPDGQSMLTASVDGSVRIWDISPLNDAGLLVLDGQGGRLTRVTIDPEGKYLATAGYDGKVKVWTMPDGQELFTLSAHSGPVWDITFSPDGQSLLTAGADNTAKVWDLRASLASPDSSPRLQISGHTSQRNSLSQPGIRGVAFSPDGTRLLTAGADGVVKIWASDTGQEIGAFEFEPTRYGVRSVASATFSPDGKQVAALAEGPESMARVWDIETGEPVFEKSRHVEWNANFALVFSPDGNLLATAGLDITVTVYDLLTGQLTNTISGYKSAVMGLDINQDGSLLATSHSDGTVKVWDLLNGQELLALNGDSAPVSSVVFSPDGQYLITSGFDGTAHVFVLNLDELIQLAHSRETRTLTSQECRQYLHMDSCPSTP
jgi:WD40 repeat protein/class 3 adenylate cyclase/tRNA A-37 threonylcarbamoyl transferase component Bud32/energy-coupling factor transporter ATP-binding protein EcfA2